MLSTADNPMPPSQNYKRAFARSQPLRKGMRCWVRPICKNSNLQMPRRRIAILFRFRAKMSLYAINSEWH